MRLEAKRSLHLMNISFSQELKHKNKSSVMTGRIRTWNMIQPWERSRSASYKMGIARGHCAPWNKTEDRHCGSSPSAAPLKVTHKQMAWSQPGLLRHKSKGLIGTWSTESKIPDSLLEMCYHVLNVFTKKHKHLARQGLWSLMPVLTLQYNVHLVTKWKDHSGFCVEIEL